jgi:hypothetical protein
MSIVTQSEFPLRSDVQHHMGNFPTPDTLCASSGVFGNGLVPSQHEVMTLLSFHTPIIIRPIILPQRWTKRKPPWKRTKGKDQPTGQRGNHQSRGKHNQEPKETLKETPKEAPKTSQTGPVKRKHDACRMSQKEACALKRMAKKMQMLLASFMQHQDNLF